MAVLTNGMMPTEAQIALMQKINALAKATGVEAVLEKAGLLKKHLLLSRMNDGLMINRPTVAPVVFHVMPIGDSPTKAGWHTVEELLAWAQGEKLSAKAPRTNGNHGTDGAGVKMQANTVHNSMDAFDALPRAVRDALNEAPHKLSPVASLARYQAHLQKVDAPQAAALEVAHIAAICAGVPPTDINPAWY